MTATKYADYVFKGRDDIPLSTSLHVTKEKQKLIRSLEQSVEQLLDKDEDIHLVPELIQPTKLAPKPPSSLKQWVIEITNNLRCNDVKCAFSFVSPALPHQHGLRSGRTQTET